VNSSHKTFLRIILFSILAFSPIRIVWALSCELSLSAKRDFVSQKLSEVPGLRIHVLKMIDDPYIPQNIKRILEISILKENVDIKQLTEELRKELNVPESFEAVALNKSTRVVRKLVDEVTPNVNQAATHAINFELLTSKFSVAASDRPITEKNNDLVYLIHELAHVRFDHFFEKNADKLLKIFPAELLQKNADGVFEVNGHLYDYLTERYAFQVTFEIILIQE